jgi:hypothetical protein
MFCNPSGAMIAGDWHCGNNCSDLEDGKSVEEAGGNDGRLSIVEEQRSEAGPSTSTSSAAPVSQSRSGGIRVGL